MDTGFPCSTKPLAIENVICESAAFALTNAADSREDVPLNRAQVSGNVQVIAADYACRKWSKCEHRKVGERVFNRLCGCDTAPLS